MYFVLFVLWTVYAEPINVDSSRYGWVSCVPLLNVYQNLIPVTP